MNRFRKIKNKMKENIFYVEKGLLKNLEVIYFKSKTKKDKTDYDRERPVQTERGQHEQGEVKTSTDLNREIRKGSD